MVVRSRHVALSPEPLRKHIGEGEGGEARRQGLGQPSPVGVTGRQTDGLVKQPDGQLRLTFAMEGDLVALATRLSASAAKLIDVRHHNPLAVTELVAQRASGGVETEGAKRMM